MILNMCSSVQFIKDWLQFLKQTNVIIFTKRNMNREYDNCHGSNYELFFHYYLFAGKAETGWTEQGNNS